MQRNGIDTDGLDGYVDLLRDEPEAGAVSVRIGHRWDGGFAMSGCSEQLATAGEGTDRTHHTFRTDWPEPLAGDSGPTPGAEGVLAMVGSCVATTYVVHATRQGVAIDDLEVTVQGTVDLRRLFDLAPAAPGVRGVDVTVRVRSDADDAVLEELARLSSRTSPGFGALAQPVPADLTVERLP
jgi:uncharacterized OsmC-like protein